MMKNIVFSIVLMFFLAMSTAYAANVEINKTVLTTGEVYFSVDKDSYDTNKASIKEDNGYVLLTNKLNASINVNLNAVLNHESDSDSKINITNNAVPLTALQENSRKDLSLSMDDDIEAGIYTGILYVKNSTNAADVYDTVPVRVIVPALEVTEITVRDAATDLSDTKLEKGQKIKILVEYKNIADQTDLENINVKVGVYDGDEEKAIAGTANLLVDLDDKELEDEKDSSDLSNGKTGTETFEFEMPFDIDDGETISILVEVTADSEDTSSKFYARDTKEVKTYVADSRVEITKASATPATLACGSNRIKLVAEVRNIGDSSEDVQAFLRNTATGFEKQLNNAEDIELDNNYENEEDFTQSVEEYVTLTDLAEGQNTYTLIAYFNDGDASVQKDVVITSQTCAAPASTTSTSTTSGTSGSSDVVVVQPTAASTTQPTASTTPTSYVTLKDVSGYGFDSDLIVPIIIGVGGLIVGIIVALLIMPKP